MNNCYNEKNECKKQVIIPGFLPQCSLYYKNTHSYKEVTSITDKYRCYLDNIV